MSHAQDVGDLATSTKGSLGGPDRNTSPNAPLPQILVFIFRNSS